MDKKNLNPRVNTEYWKVLDKQSEPKGHRLILHIDRDSLVAIKSTGYKTFTGLSQGTVKVLKDPGVQREEDVMLDTVSSKSVPEGEGDNILTPSNDRQGAARNEEEIPLITKSSSADQGTPLMETRSDARETAKEERMETGSLPNDKKELNT
jgi:hypothetical protein